MVETSTMIGIVFSIIGIVLFLYCVVVVKKILNLFPKAKMRTDWMIISILIIFFVIGYGANIWALTTNNIQVLTFMQSFVYLFGAIFVLVVIQLSYRTYKIIVKSAEE